MVKPEKIISWLNHNRHILIEVLRIYLGIALTLKGIEFFSNPKQADAYMEMINLPLVPFLSVHIIALVHMAGGILLTIGLITRIAALIQIPILLGAVFLVHWHDGFFLVDNQNLAYAIQTLVLLLFFFGYGSGRLSVDNFIIKK